MLRGFWAMAAMVCGLAAGGGVSAQQVTGARPAEAPPASFTGRQYVDSRGCAFIRAGFAGQVNWVPRLTLQKQPVCGLPPSLGAARLADTPRPAEPAPVQAAPRMTGRLAGCPPGAPYGQRVAVTDGRRGLLCTAAPAQLVSGPVAVAQVAAIPAPPTPAPVEVPAPARPAPAKASQPQPVPAPPMKLAALPAMPQGYRAVWTDDRLNPNRGGRSAAGRAAMNAVWTQTVPRRLIDPRDKGLGPVAGPPRVSTRSAPVQAGQFVQVGVFGLRENAATAAARLAALGLPVRRIRAGNGAEAVLAGPFADPAAARAALAASRGAGFGDAYLRR